MHQSTCDNLLNMILDTNRGRFAGALKSQGAGTFMMIRCKKVACKPQYSGKWFQNEKCLNIYETTLKAKWQPIEPRLDLQCESCQRFFGFIGAYRKHSQAIYLVHEKVDEEVHVAPFQITRWSCLMHKSCSHAVGRCTLHAAMCGQCSKGWRSSNQWWSVMVVSCIASVALVTALVVLVAIDFCPVLLVVCDGAARKVQRQFQFCECREVRQGDHEQNTRSKAHDGHRSWQDSHMKGRVLVVFRNDWQVCRSCRRKREQSNMSMHCNCKRSQRSETVTTCKVTTIAKGRTGSVKTGLLTNAIEEIYSWSIMLQQYMSTAWGHLQKGL